MNRRALLRIEHVADRVCVRPVFAHNVAKLRLRVSRIRWELFGVPNCPGVAATMGDPAEGLDGFRLRADLGEGRCDEANGAVDRVHRRSLLLSRGGGLTMNARAPSQPPGLPRERGSPSFPRP